MRRIASRPDGAKLHAPDGCEVKTNANAALKARLAYPQLIERIIHTGFMLLPKIASYYRRAS
jgi:hypothetical protein